MIHAALPEVHGDPGAMPGMPLPELPSPRVLQAPAGRRVRPVRQKKAVTDNPFSSFWMGGYDDPAQGGSRGVLHSSALLRESYGGLLDFGVKTVREEADWSRIDTPDGLDLQLLDARARMAKEHDLQIVWTLCGRRWPADVRFLSAEFVERFARYASAVASRMAEFDPARAPVFVPINEISFLAWSLFTRGEIRQADGSRPALSEIKRQLVRASIAASDAILAAIPHARLLQTDPLEHVVAPVDRGPLAESAELRAELRTEMQYEAWDWISGRACKDLGGQARFLDLVGVNYYADNQWEIGTGKRLGWQIDDRRRLPLCSLLKRLHLRYQRPIAIAETSHSGIRRGAWVREIANEVRSARQIGVRIEGVCLHPLIDGASSGKSLLRGLWEVREESNCGGLALSEPYAAALRAAQKTVDGEQFALVPAHSEPAAAQ